MKKWKWVLVAVLASLPAALRGQVVDFGLAAGYSLNNEALHLKGATTATWLGVNHGFYAGPQVDFNVGKGFSIRTGLNFRKGGTNLFLDLEKLSVNLNQIELDLENGNKLLFDFLKENPDLDINGMTSQQLMDGIDTYHQYAEQAVTTLKGTDIKANINRYSLNMPVLLRYTSGRLSVNAGVNLSVMIFNKIDMTANLPGGIVYSDRDLEKFLPYAHLVVTGAPPTSENPRMSVERFYSLDMTRRFTVGLQFGLDYSITEWVSLHLAYQYGLLSELVHPWTDLCTLHDRSFQAGLVYHFRFKKK